MAAWYCASVVTMGTLRLVSIRVVSDDHRHHVVRPAEIVAIACPVRTQLVHHRSIRLSADRSDIDDPVAPPSQRLSGQPPHACRVDALAAAKTVAP